MPRCKFVSAHLPLAKVLYTLSCPEGSRAHTAQHSDAADRSAEKTHLPAMHKKHLRLQRQQVKANLLLCGNSLLVSAGFPCQPTQRVHQQLPEHFFPSRRCSAGLLPAPSRGAPSDCGTRAPHPVLQVGPNALLALSIPARGAEREPMGAGWKEAMGVQCGAALLTPLNPPWTRWLRSEDTSVPLPY